MKTLIIKLLCLMLVMQARAQTPVIRDFRGPLPADTLDRYLSRAITMSRLNDLIWCANQGGTSSQTCGNTYYNPTIFDEDVQMLPRINARFIGRAAGLWQNEWVLKYNYMPSAGEVVSRINAAYGPNRQKPIIQAAIFEIATSAINSFEIPNYVLAAFDLPPNVPGTIQQFNISQMRYDSYPDDTNYQTKWLNNGQEVGIVPDMSKIQTQMWFYYLATQYINAGYEAIHFGQIRMMDKVDGSTDVALGGHRGWHKMLCEVRKYAATFAVRRMVLCDAHTNEAYYDPSPQQPNAIANRQLLFDFHSYPLRIQQDPTHQTWGSAGSGNGGGALLTASPYNCDPPIFTRSKGGLTLFNGYVNSLPYLVEFDHAGAVDNPGFSAGQGCWPWGWDEISWFGVQRYAYRNQWLKYAYYQTKCLEPYGNGHLQMPGVREMTGTPKHLYRASAGPEEDGHFNQEAMIKALWGGEYDNDWFHSIIQASSYTASNTNVASSSVSVGNNLYYIGTDGRIHAYIEYGNQWITTSPSWVAHSIGFNNNMPSQLIRNQQLAAGNLVATADGQYLFYRGVDGEVYGFEIGANPYQNYRYFKLPATRPLVQEELVQSDLICVGHDLYYRSNSNKIYAYIENGTQWVPTSPTWASANSVAVDYQADAAGGLVVNPSHNRLYYRGVDSFIHGFVIHNGYSYEYFDLRKDLVSAEEVTGQLVCATDNRLFYVGRGERIYGLLLGTGPYALTSTVPNGTPTPNTFPAGGAWSKISPSHSAGLTPNDGLHEQSKAIGQLAASPNGNVLVYLGTDGNLHGFRVLDVGWNSEYFDFPIVAPADLPSRDLRFKSNTELFYISNNSNTLHKSTLQPQLTACENPAIGLIGKAYNYYPRNAGTQERKNPVAHATPVIVTAYPNPVADHLILPEQVNNAALFNSQGKLVQQADGHGTLNVQTLPDGLYNLRMQQDGKMVNQHIEVKH